MDTRVLSFGAVRNKATNICRHVFVLTDALQSVNAHQGSRTWLYDLSDYQPAHHPPPPGVILPFLLPLPPSLPHLYPFFPIIPRAVGQNSVSTDTVSHTMPQLLSEERLGPGQASPHPLSPLIHSQRTHPSNTEESESDMSFLSATREWRAVTPEEPHPHQGPPTSAPASLVSQLRVLFLLAWLVFREVGWLLGSHQRDPEPGRPKPGSEAGRFLSPALSPSSCAMSCPLTPLVGARPHPCRWTPCLAELPP